MVRNDHNDESVEELNTHVTGKITGEERSVWISHPDSQYCSGKRIYQVKTCPQCGGASIKRPYTSTPETQEVEYQCIEDNDCSWSFVRGL